MKLLTALGLAVLQTATVLSAEIVYRQPLNEAGQSGVCLHGDRLFLTMHSKLEGRMKGGFFFNGNIVGQCLDKTTGKLLWQVDLPGTWAGRVLESWHDSTSLLPVATEKYVVFHNLNGMLACFTHEGKPVWNRKWQAPNPDIKNCRMFLKGGNLLVSMPSDKIAVEENTKHPALPFYQIHSIDLVTGKDVWVSPVLLHHGTQYSLDKWKGDTVIVASMIDLSHWKFKQGRKGYLLSLADGKPILTFDLPPAIPHQKNHLLQGKLLVTGTARKETQFYLIDPENSKITAEFAFEEPDQYFAWNGKAYAETDFVPEYVDRTLKGKGQPTPSTVHAFEDRIYFWRYNSGDIGCIDMKTGKSVMVEAPIQVLANKVVWNKVDFQFTKGILNSRDQVVNKRVGSVRGIQRGGFGHTNPAWPIQYGKNLYWQGGAGVLYVIDLTQPFSPSAFSWIATDIKGASWTFGEPAIDESGIYVRSQRDLVRITR
jgi:outer membrane protein assembly factor BamB